tara:strand:+ start:491674 stop:492246 length:573 start_codon:yes stop_codon:yes gene_type:complete
MSQSLVLPKPEELKIRLSPYSTLYERAQEVPVSKEGFEDADSTRAYCDRLIALLESTGNRGIGLAANQAGLLLRIFICRDNLNDPAAKDRPCRAYINPKILSGYGGKIAETEGCLSFPGVNGPVERYQTIDAEWYDINGAKHHQPLTGLHARCFIHEVDHLDGVNIPDRFDDAALKRNRAALKRLGYRRH